MESERAAASRTWTPCHGRWLPEKRTRQVWSDRPRSPRHRPRASRWRGVNGVKLSTFAPQVTISVFARAKSGTISSEGREQGRGLRGRDPRGSAASAARAGRRGRPFPSPRGPRSASSPRGPRVGPAPPPRAPPPPEVVVALEDDLGARALEEGAHDAPGAEAEEAMVGPPADAVEGRSGHVAPPRGRRPGRAPPRAPRGRGPRGRAPPPARARCPRCGPAPPGRRPRTGSSRRLLEHVLDVADHHVLDEGDPAQEAAQGAGHRALEEARDPELLVTHGRTRRGRSTRAERPHADALAQAVAQRLAVLGGLEEARLLAASRGTRRAPGARGDGRGAGSPDGRGRDAGEGEGAAAAGGRR